MMAAKRSSATQIPLMQTSPDVITLHRVEDHELETLMNISRPYSLAFSTMTMGAFLGLLPSVMAALDRAHDGLTNSELATIIVSAGCLFSALISGSYALRALIDANKAIKRIRARPASPC